MQRFKKKIRWEVGLNGKSYGLKVGWPKSRPSLLSWASLAACQFSYIQNRNNIHWLFQLLVWFKHRKDCHFIHLWYLFHWRHPIEWSLEAQWIVRQAHSYTWRVCLFPLTMSLTAASVVLYNQVLRLNIIKLSFSSFMHLRVQREWNLINSGGFHEIEVKKRWEG